MSCPYANIYKRQVPGWGQTRCKTTYSCSIDNMSLGNPCSMEFAEKVCPKYRRIQEQESLEAKLDSPQHLKTTEPRYT